MDVMKMGVVWNEKARVAWQKMVVLKINLVLSRRCPGSEMRLCPLDPGTMLNA